MMGDPLPRKGIIQYTPEALRKLLGLPDDVEVYGVQQVRWDDFDNDNIKVKVRGDNPALPHVREGEDIPEVNAEDLIAH